MDNQAKLIEWGSKYLLSKECSIEHPPEIVIETPWSIVVRFVTVNGNFYLKQTPADLFIETKVIQAIQKNMPQSGTPKIVSENPELHCFLMKSCGDYSLRTKFNGTLDADLLIEGITSYIKILRRFEKNLDGIIAIDVPDWRLNRIPHLYVELLHNKEMLLEEGLTHDEIEQLMSLVPNIELVCQSLEDTTIKETLVNGDFNENNVIINDKTQQLAIVDWGECIIAHPFFSIASHLQSLARRYKLDLHKGILETIRHQCLSCWLDVANLNELEIIYQKLLKLHPIFCALAIYRLQAATHNKSKAMQNWFIAGFLKRLLQGFRE